MKWNRLRLELSNFFLYALILVNFIRVFIYALLELTIAGICGLIGYLGKNPALLRYAVNKGLAIDQWGNTELLGHPDETISSRLGRSIGQERYFWVKVMRIMVDGMFFFDYKICEKTGRKIKHCESSIIPLEQESFKTFDYEIWDWTKKEAGK